MALPAIPSDGVLSEIALKADSASKGRPRNFVSAPRHEPRI